MLHEEIKWLGMFGPPANGAPTVAEFGAAASPPAQSRSL
jgi:hypothetical protein